MEDNDILVAISLVTYNHEDYIRQAIEGILIQQVDFKIKLIITNDCSSDNTDIICREYAIKYPELVDYENLKNNKGMVGNWLYNLQKCLNYGAQFIAICEGDDYWIDSLKLKKQVEFLKRNEEFAVCNTHCKIFNQTLDKFIEGKQIGMKEYSLIDFQLKSENNLNISTCTTVFEASILKKINFIKLKKYMSNISAVDSFIISIVLTSGLGKVLNDVTAVYRITDKGASSKFNKYSWHKIRIKTLSFIIDFNLIKNYEHLTWLKSRLKKIKSNYYKFRVINFLKYFGIRIGS